MQTPTKKHKQEDDPKPIKQSKTVVQKNEDLDDIGKKKKNIRCISI